MVCKNCDRQRTSLIRGATGADRVAIIDFDWSGPPTQAYPFFMNHTDLTWPEGAVDGQTLAFAHDKEWIKRSFV